MIANYNCKRDAVLLTSGKNTEHMTQEIKFELKQNSKLLHEVYNK